VNQKKTNEKPSSNFQEEIPKDGVPHGDKVVKKEEDKDYTEDDRLNHYLKKMHKTAPNEIKAIENDEKVLMMFLKEAQAS